MGILNAVTLALCSSGVNAVARNLRAKESLEAESTKESLKTPTPNSFEYHNALTGMFSFQQKSTGRHLDAYEKRFFAKRPGFEAVLRAKQQDYSQKWILHGEPSGYYSITHAETGRFLDAYENNPDPTGAWTWDRVVVTRLAQEASDNLSQRWVITAVPGSVEGSGEYYIRQASTRFFLDSFEDMEHDYQVCLRGNQTLTNGTHDPSQVWILRQEEDLPDLDGIYIFKQKDTKRLLDAHQSMRGNHEVITRDVEFSPSQHFVIRRVMGYAYTVLQESTGLFLDAYETANADFHYNFGAVMRPYQPDDSQKWFIEKLAYNEFRFMHHVTGRMLTAYEDQAHDFMAHTGPRDELEDEIWMATKIGEIPQLEGIWTIQQKSSGKYLDAYPTKGPYAAAGGLGFEAVVRPKQPDNSQNWKIIKKDGEVYQIEQESSGKLLDALEQADPLWNRDHAACVRPPQRNPSQMWYFQWVTENEFTIRHHSNTRYLDAWPDAAHDFLAVTRELQPNDPSQIWILTKVGSLCVPATTCIDEFMCGDVDDGCGGRLHCGNLPNGTCSGFNHLANKSYDCLDHQCVCAPKLACDANHTCGYEADGCGGKVFCGNQGNCTTSNPISGVRDKCMFDPNNFTLNPPPPVWMAAPSPALAAAGMIPVVPGFEQSYECVCQPRLKCTDTSQCGVEDDGCGGHVICNSSPEATMEGNCSKPQHVCSANHTCECMPKTVCDPGNDCGFQDDGCGGTVACGLNGTCANGTNYVCSVGAHASPSPSPSPGPGGGGAGQCICKPTPCGEWLCGIIPDDGCGKEVNCGGCQVADRMCNTEKHMCEPAPPPPCPNPPCGGPSSPAPAPGVSPAPWSFPVPMPGPAPAGPAGPSGPAPGTATKGPSPAPGPDVTPIDVPKDLKPAMAAAAASVDALATGHQPPPIALPALQSTSPKNRVKNASLTQMQVAAGLPPINIPHNGNMALRNSLPFAEEAVATEAVLAVNDTLWTEKPFWASLKAVHSEQDELRADLQGKITAAIQGLVSNAYHRAEQATRTVLNQMPQPYIDASLHRLRRTFYDRIVQHIPGVAPAAAPAPAPMSTPGSAPVTAADSDNGDKDSEEVKKKIEKVARETLLEGTAKIDDTKKWMLKVAKQYTVDATVESVKAAWPASQAIGQSIETQIMSADAKLKAQSAYNEAVASMQANAKEAATRPADAAALSVAPEAVHIASTTATEHLSKTIARQSILNAQHVLGGLAGSVVVDQVSGQVQDMTDGPDLAHNIDRSMRLVDKTAPAEFGKLATQTADDIIAQMKAAEGVPGPSPAPSSANPAQWVMWAKAPSAPVPAPAPSAR